MASKFEKQFEDSVLHDALQNGSKGFEFKIEPPSDFEEDKVEEYRLDMAYNLDEYINHINLDCITVNDAEESNSLPFDTIAARMTNLTPDGGVKKRTLRSGSGNKVTEKAVVYLHYNSYLELEEVPFDSSYLRTSKKAQKYTLGQGNYYPGFEIAVMSMCQEEKAQFLIQPKYAFGSMGVPPRIPGGATIMVEIDLIKILCTEDLPSDQPEVPEREDLKDFQTAFKKAKSMHLRGNDFFKNSIYNEAIKCYLKSRDLLTSCSLQNDKEEADMKHLLMKQFTNLCICYNKINVPQKVCIFAQEALHLDPQRANRDAKLYYNWGRALISLDLRRAGEKLRKAQNLEPNNKLVSQALVEVNDKLKKEKEIEKITYKRALGLSDVQSESHQSPHYSPSQLEMINELNKFKESTREKMEFPSGLDKSETDVIRKTCRELNLVCRQVPMDNTTVLVVSKFIR